MSEKTTNPAEEAPEVSVQTAPETPETPEAPAASDTPQKKKGSRLLIFLTVLLIIVGIADVILWGVAGYYFLRGARIGGGGGAAPIVSTGGAQIGSGGESGGAEQEALRAYIQQMASVSKQEKAVLESFGGVSGTSYVDDATMYAEISERTIPLCQQLNEQVLAIVPSDPEISQVHGIYRDYVTSYLNALSTLVSALNSADAAQVTQANNLINETNDTAVSYQQALQKLANERGVTLNS